jgi:hypothetical protein
MAEVEVPNPEELEEIKGKAFTRRVALTTAIFAVLLAVTSLGGNNATKELMLTQQQSSDQWAFYQSKTIREHLYRAAALRAEADLAGAAALAPEQRGRLEAVLKTFRDEERRYAEEKRKIEEEAKRLEAERDHNLAKDPYFDYAEVLLQIAIVLASIAILSSSGAIFGAALAAAAGGTAMMVNGYLLLVHLPFFR